MSSGEWLLAFLVYSNILFLVIFIPWELINLQRRRKGNKTSLTASQQLIKNIKQGHKPALVFAIVYPLFLFIIGFWLFWHFEGLCHWQGWLCDLSSRF